MDSSFYKVATAFSAYSFFIGCLAFVMFWVMHEDGNQQITMEYFDPQKDPAGEGEKVPELDPVFTPNELRKRYVEVTEFQNPDLSKVKGKLQRLFSKRKVIQNIDNKKAGLDEDISPKSFAELKLMLKLCIAEIERIDPAKEGLFRKSPSTNNRWKEVVKNLINTKTFMLQVHDKKKQLTDLDPIDISYLFKKILGNRKPRVLPRKMISAIEEGDVEEVVEMRNPMGSTYVLKSSKFNEIWENIDEEKRDLLRFIARVACFHNDKIPKRKEGEGNVQSQFIDFRGFSTVVATNLVEEEIIDPTKTLAAEYFDKTKLHYHEKISSFFLTLFLAEDKEVEEKEKFKTQLEATVKAMKNKKVYIY